MRLPGLPVSRRRHEAEVELELRDEFDHERAVRAKLERELIQERDEARARVAELEAAIRSHREHEFPDGEYDAVQRFEQAMEVNRRLWRVLDGQRGIDSKLPPDGFHTFNGKWCHTCGTYCRQKRKVPYAEQGIGDRDPEWD